MMKATPVDSGWIAAHPTPIHGPGTDKNSRGRVLAVGGSRTVPGALRLTGEAALRAGAGKLQMATVEAAAMMLGVAVPEAGVIALPEDERGEIAQAAADALIEALGRADAAVLGPGMSDPASTDRLLRAVLAERADDVALVLDAAAIGCAKDMRELLAPYRGRMVLTPHHGEMAALTGMDVAEIADTCEETALRVAAEFGAVVVLKSSDTVIADADGTLLHYGGGGIGLATGGSGDVLAGAIAGLLSRGAVPLVAAG